MDFEYLLEMALVIFWPFIPAELNNYWASGCRQDVRPSCHWLHSKRGLRKRGAYRLPNTMWHYIHTQIKKLLLKFNTSHFLCLPECARRKPTCLAGEGRKNNERSVIRIGAGGGGGPRHDGTWFTLLITGRSWRQRRKPRLTFASPETHQGFPLAQRVDRLQAGIAVQRVRVHAVLEGLHLLDDFLQCRVFDAHVVDGVQKGNAVRKTLLHLLHTHRNIW